MGIYGGDVGTTILRTPEALAVAEAIGDQRTIARARITINYIRAMFAPQEGVTALAEAIELARSGGDQWAVADGLKVMTIAWAAQGDYDRGLQAARDLAGVANRLGNKFFSPGHTRRWRMWPCGGATSWQLGRTWSPRSDSVSRSATR